MCDGFSAEILHDPHQRGLDHLFMLLCYALCQDVEQQPEVFLRNSIAVVAAPSMYELIHSHTAYSVDARIAFLS